MPEKTQDMSLSIIIPCYNEEENLSGGGLDSVVHYIKQQHFVSEIIVVNDGCSDGSQLHLDQTTKICPALHIVTIPHSGKPAALWAGIQRARGRIVLLADLDQSTPIYELDKLLPWLYRGYDVVIGSRGKAREGLSPIRRAGSFIFGHLRRFILLKDIVDTQCGFKAMRRDIALNIFPQTGHILADRKPEGWKVTAYDVELLYLIDRAGYSIKEVEVVWKDRDRSTTKRAKNPLLQYFQESLEMAKEVIRIKRNERSGRYNGLLPQDQI